MYFLMIKTHNTTGFKYLCQTKRKDPFKYPGSGKHWRLHLDKHGYDFKTEIIGVYETKEELKEAGIHYSNLYNVVESTEWANLRIEDGDGGDTSKTDGYISGMQKRRSYVGEGNPNFGKVGGMRGKTGPMLGMTWYNNGVKELLCEKCPEGWTEGRIQLECEHCHEKVSKTNYKRWHGENCKHNPNQNIETRLVQKLALKGQSWWNNGTATKKSKECPGDGWVKGRLKSQHN